MFYYEGLSCPVCGKVFFEDEDIVVCPKCGLPHHRGCWQTIGKCYEEHNHDTPAQWSRERAAEQPVDVPQESNATQKQFCTRCGMENAEFAEFCTRCGHPLRTADWHSSEPNTSVPPISEYSPYRYDGTAYSASEMIGEHNAEELAAVVDKNAQYYIPRFRNVVRTGSGGWNWAAFLLGPFWLFYRKQYGLGFLYFAVHMLANIAFSVAYAPVSLAETEEAMLAAETALMTSPVFFIAALLTMMYLILKIFLGVKGNDFYLQFCEKKLSDAKQKTPDLSTAEVASVGGVSLWVAILFYVLASMAVDFITLIAMH